MLGKKEREQNFAQTFPNWITFFTLLPEGISLGFPPHYNIFGGGKGGGSPELS